MLRTPPGLLAGCSPSSEPSSLASSPSGSPPPEHRRHIHQHRLKDSYSSLERLNRRPRVQKCSLEKLFARRASFESTRSTARSDGRSSSGVRRHCSSSSSSDEGDGEGLLDNADFIRNRKERSTVLVRRFFKNNRKMTKSVCTGTRAIVKALPSGSISEDVWEVVAGQRAPRPAEENARPDVTRASKEEFGVCRDMLRFIGVKLRQPFC
ncbi:1-phosphatidylinositol 4,5-bisphosphate phosphodiesterase epsilon-1 [Liparis tanakae]|uniref:1-phosphatidylinositol 4,5-bisphosphate phosphodiesterase epsilon-1 n=1 Tax=Liparis tanakae TaxID=230148 RepID=A0A4Z2G9R4_9TELE|nr:1-phosphatidylinositol 4,5-bisphosphate phosphodiesterase epsilon-1 [Liparis tanakae]